MLELGNDALVGHGQARREADLAKGSGPRFVVLLQGSFDDALDRLLAHLKVRL